MSRGVHIPKALVLLLLSGSFLVVGAAGSATAAIYWQNESAEIGRANLDGSNADPEFIHFPTLLSTSNSTTSCGGVAVDGEHIYWADNWHETIGRAKLDGSEVEGAFIIGADEPCGLAVDSSHVYWVNWEGGTIGRANLDGGSVQQDFLEVGWRSCGVTVSDSYLFWADMLGNVDRANLTGGERVEPLVPGGSFCGLTTAGGRVFWADWGGSIGSSTFDGTEIDPELVSGLASPCGVAVHDGEIYWAEQPFLDPGSIGRAAVDGTSVERGIVTGLFRPCGMAVDDLPVPPKPVLEPGRLSLGPVVHNSRNGSMLVPIDVTAAGNLTITLAKPIHSKLLGGGPRVSAGRHWLKLSVGPGSAASWPRSGLRRRGRVEITLAIGYAPDVGPTKFIAKPLWMWRAKRARAKS